MRVVSAAVMLAVAAVSMTACRVGGQDAAAPKGTKSAVIGQDNGVSALPAKEIARRAGRAIHNVAVHVRGTFSDGGSQISTMDTYSSGFDAGRSTVSEADTTTEVVRVDGKVYVRAPAIVWTSLGMPALSNAATSARADGKFVRIPTGPPEFFTFTKFLDISRIAEDELTGTDTATATETATLDGTAIINGVPTVAVTLAIGTIYVATVGEPYVIRWGTPGGTLDFSDYLMPVVVDAPPADKVIDWDDLTRNGYE